MSGAKLRIERVLPAPPAEVFAAWTEAASLARWMCPNEILRDARRA